MVSNTGLMVAFMKGNGSMMWLMARELSLIAREMFIKVNSKTIWPME